jgi:hypothetical protein
MSLSGWRTRKLRNCPDTRSRRATVRVRLVNSAAASEAGYRPGHRRQTAVPAAAPARWQRHDGNEIAADRCKGLTGRPRQCHRLGLAVAVSAGNPIAAGSVPEETGCSIGCRRWGGRCLRRCNRYRGVRRNTGTIRSQFMLSCPLRLGRGWRDCHIRTARSLINLGALQTRPDRVENPPALPQKRTPCWTMSAWGGLSFSMMRDRSQLEARQRRHAVEDTGCTGCHDIITQTHAKLPP